MLGKAIGWLIGIVVVVVVALILLFQFVERVPEGKVAVVYTPSEGATEVLNPGWHVIGFLDKTQQYPTRIQTVKDEVKVSTTDGKQVTMTAHYDMKVKADKETIIGIFKNLGSQDIESIQEGYLYKQLFKASRETISQYSLLDVYGTKTTEASAKVTEDFAKLVEPMGFEITDVTLGTPEADAATQESIDARVKAAQQNEQKKLELENDKIEAERKIVQANAEADANRIVSESITDELLKQQEMEARQKWGWVEVTGADSLIVDKDK